MARKPIPLERRRKILKLLREERSINFICKNANTSTETIQKVAAEAGIKLRARGTETWHHPTAVREQVRTLIERGKTAKVITRETGCGALFITKVAGYYGLEITSGKTGFCNVERERAEDYGFVKGSKPKWDFSGENLDLPGGWNAK